MTSSTITKEKFHAFLELGRVSNLPTCISNVTVGFYLGGGLILKEPIYWLASTTSILCIYESGMILNSIFDYKIDQQERPSRPLPSGRITLLEAWVLYFTFQLIGIFVAAIFCSQAIEITLLLTVFIISYNTLHIKYSWTTFLLGACRGCVYIISSVYAGTNLPSLTVLIFSTLLALYITIVSLIARQELKTSITGQQRYLIFLTVIALFSPYLIRPELMSTLQSVAAMIALVWVFYLTFSTWRKSLTPQSIVGKLLAATSLFDAIILSKLNSGPGVVMALGCFSSTLLWQRKVRGT